MKCYGVYLEFINLICNGVYQIHFLLNERLLNITPIMTNSLKRDKTGMGCNIYKTMCCLIMLKKIYKLL